MEGAADSSDILLLLLNLTRSESFFALPGNQLKKEEEEEEEHDREETEQLRKMYQTIPGYEFIGECTNYPDESVAGEIRAKLVTEFHILDLLLLEKHSFKIAEEVSEAVFSEILLNLAEVNTLKPILVQHVIRGMTHLVGNGEEIAGVRAEMQVAGGEDSCDGDLGADVHQRS